MSFSSDVHSAFDPDIFVVADAGSFSSRTVVMDDAGKRLMEAGPAPLRRRTVIGAWVWAVLVLLIAAACAGYIWSYRRADPLELTVVVVVACAVLGLPMTWLFPVRPILVRAADDQSVLLTITKIGRGHTFRVEHPTAGELGTVERGLFGRFDWTLTDRSGWFVAKVRPEFDWLCTLLTATKIFKPLAHMLATVTLTTTSGGFESKLGEFRKVGCSVSGTSLDLLPDTRRKLDHRLAVALLVLMNHYRS